MLEEFNNGICDYITYEVIPNVRDVTTKVALGMIVRQMRNNPELLNGVVDQPVVKMFIGDDIGSMVQSLTESVDAYGNIVITIPKIPFIMPNEQKLAFGPDDVRKMRSYLMR